MYIGIKNFYINYGGNSYNNKYLCSELSELWNLLSIVQLYF
jgi:hypothetical protein